MNQRLRSESPEYPWGNTLDVLRTADWRVCNLECVLADRGRPWSMTDKVFHFRSDAKNVAALKAARIDLVSVANNHVLDFEYDAMADMLKSLRLNGLRFAGAGATDKESKAVARWKLKGLNMGMIACTDNEPDWETRADRPGVYYVPMEASSARAKDLFARVREAKRNIEILVVSLHWGGNWGYEPLNEQIEMAHALIDAGADFVFGHSPHVFRGIELYRGRPILYSAGDFIDDYAVDEVERNDRGFIYMLDVAGPSDQARISQIRLFPTVIRGFQAWHALQPEQDLINNKMIGLCRELGTLAQHDTATGGLFIDVIEVEPNPELKLMAHPPSLV